MEPSNDNTSQEQPDVRIDETNLPKPGEAIKPQTEAEKAQAAATAMQSNTTQQDYEKQLQSITQPEAPEQESTEDGGKKHPLFVELLVWGAITIGIVLFIQNFVFQAFYVSGSSMEPDYHNNDYLIISKLPITQFDIGHLFGQKNMNAHRGDVIVFRYPNAPDTFFIKRIIGLPGDRVVLKDGVYTIYNKDNPDGLILKESYVDPQYVTQGSIDEVVEQGKFFVSGDNRSPGGSFDSREWGQLPQGNVTGFAVLRLLPVNTIKFGGSYKYENQ